MRRNRILATLAVAAFAAGCATLNSLGLNIAAPQFEVASGYDSELRLRGPSSASPMGGATIRIWTRVQNPNPIGLTLAAVAGNFFVEGTNAANVSFPLGLPLAANQDTVIPLDLHVDFDDVPALAQIAADALLSSRDLGYRLDGTVAVDAGPLGTPSFGPNTLLEGMLELRR